MSRQLWRPSSTNLYYTLPLLILGFVLASAGTSSNPFAWAVFGFGVVLWAIGVLGIVYSVACRLAGPRAAKLAVAALLMTVLIPLIFGGKRDRDVEV